MTLDERGNLYLTGAGVDIFTAGGDKLGTIEVPERPANVCFGGKDRKTLFITARTSFICRQDDRARPVTLALFRPRFWSADILEGVSKPSFRS